MAYRGGERVAEAGAAAAALAAESGGAGLFVHPITVELLIAAYISARKIRGLIELTAFLRNSPESPFNYDDLKGIFEGLRGDWRKKVDLSSGRLSYKNQITDAVIYFPERRGEESLPAPE